MLHLNIQRFMDCSYISHNFVILEEVKVFLKVYSNSRLLRIQAFVERFKTFAGVGNEIVFINEMCVLLYFFSKKQTGTIHIIDISSYYFIASTSEDSAG